MSSEIYPDPANSNAGPDSDPSSKTESFFRLFTGCQNHLYALILMMVHHEEDAADLLQETAVAMWENFDTYDPSRNFLAWGIGIARHKIRNFHRATQRTRVRLRAKLYEQIAEQVTHMSDQVTEQSRALTHCLKKLGETDQRFIVMRYEEGLPINKIAEKAGRSPQSMYKTMARIHNMLERCISRAIASEGSVS